MRLFQYFILTLTIGFIELFCISAAATIKVAVLTDIHLDLNYDSTVSHEGKCRKGRVKSPTIAPYGRKSCDSPYSLAESALEQIKKLKPDLLLIPGDIVNHFSQIHPNQKFSGSAYGFIKKTIANFTALVKEKLPGTPVVYTVGNDDYVYNYQVPSSMIKKDYYGFLYEQWIKSFLAVIFWFFFLRAV